MYWSVIAETALTFLVGVLFGVGLTYLLVRAAPLQGPLTSRQALLLAPNGQLDSVRTLTGAPPERITCAAGTYRRDRTAQSDHWVYRRG